MPAQETDSALGITRGTRIVRTIGLAAETDVAFHHTARLTSVVVPTVLEAPPEVGSFARRLYENLKPLAYADESLGWPLLILCGAIGDVMYQDVYDYSGDSADGPGWSAIVDLNRAPLVGIPWLAQFIGAEPPARHAEESDADYLPRVRSYIADVPGFKRGTVAAITTAAQLFLTGAKTVTLVEQDTSPYHSSLFTLTHETPDAAAVNAVIQAAKPAGLIIEHQVVDGQLWADLIADHVDWAAVIADYATWADAIEDPP